LKIEERDIRRDDRETGVAVGHDGEKGGECVKDILPVGLKSGEAAGLKKRHHKMF
jgi:hypothetical protein